MKTNYITAKINKIKAKGGLCGDKDEMINHIMNEYTKLAPKRVED